MPTLCGQCGPGGAFNLLAEVIHFLNGTARYYTVGPKPTIQRLALTPPVVESMHVQATFAPHGDILQEAVNVSGGPYDALD